jgi:PAS domain S-box-containing protein
MRNARPPSKFHFRLPLFATPAIMVIIPSDPHYGASNVRDREGRCMFPSLPGQFQRRVLAGPLSERVSPIVLTVAIGVGYFVAARLSLHLLTKPGVAVFWPAAGISSGILIALGRDARWPVAVAVVAANTVANLMGDRDVWGSGFFSLCDAGEALFVAWMIERYIGPDFSLGKLRHVLGLLAAAVVGTAVSGIGGTVAYKLTHSPNASAWITWQQWFASDSIGIVTVAPLIIGLVAALRAPPPRRELVEGAMALVAAVTMTAFIILLLPRDLWDARAPLVLLFPVLLWPAARCRPVFASATSFAVSLMLVLAVTFDIGYFHGASSSSELVLATQVRVLGAALCTLFLASLFAEQRQTEVRLREALAAGGVFAFEWDVRTDLSRRSGNAAQILGIDPELIPTAASFLARVHPDDRARLKVLRSSVHRDNAMCSVIFRFMRPDGQEIWLQETSKAEFDAAGRLVRVKGLARDITERKRAEEHDALLQLAQASTGVGVWGLNVRTKELRVSAELEEILGLKPGSIKDYTDFRELVHPDDIEFVEAHRDAAIQKHQRLQHEFRIIRPNGETRWLAGTGSVVYDEVTGEPIRFLGSSFDITERKRAEEHQGLLIAELDHRVKNILAQVAAVADSTRRGSRSIDEFLESLDGRIQAMAIAHALLSAAGWQSVGLDALVRNQLAPYATGSNVTISGPDFLLNSAETQAVARVLHELATNAAKYGALSIPGGQVSVTWDRKPNGAATHLTLVWCEFGGPPVASENPPSYGTNLIRNLIPHELGGTVDLVFATEGVNCRIEMPVSP